LEEVSKVDKSLWVDKGFFFTRYEWQFLAFSSEKSSTFINPINHHHP